MSSPASPFIKVCCIASIEEARTAVALGASAVGLVSAMPSGPGVIGEAQIADIARATSAPTASFLLTALRDAAQIAAQHDRCRTTAIQLVDTLPPRELRLLREHLPGVQLVQVIHVTGPAALDEARAVEPLVDALLLDSGNPALRVKVLGGTGRVHDWGVSARICRAARIPVLLAGGLNPDNAARAMREVAPFGLDVCSGVRTQGQLDADKLQRFAAAARQQATS